MLELTSSTPFRKDYKRIKKRGYDMSLLETVLDTLCFKIRYNHTGSL